MSNNDKLKDKLIESLRWAERNVEAFDLNQYASNDIEYVIGKSYFEGQVDILKELLKLLEGNLLINRDDILALDSYENQGDQDE